MKINTKLFFVIWLICLTLFIFGQMFAPPNYIEIPNNPWGNLFGSTFMIGSISFLLMVVYAITTKKNNEADTKAIKKPFKLTKNKNLMYILATSGLLIVIFLIYSPFRYEITGTNKGYIYKTDRLTGKTFVVSPSGEIEINSIDQTADAKAVIDFPLAFLQITDLKSNKGTFGEVADVVIKNTNVNKNARGLKFKITYSKIKGGEVFDTEYYNSTEIINSGDTRTISIPLKDFEKQVWFEIAIIGAVE